jgi:hypothetical protein
MVIARLVPLKLPRLQRLLEQEMEDRRTSMMMVKDLLNQGLVVEIQQDRKAEVEMMIEKRRKQAEVEQAEIKMRNLEASQDNVLQRENQSHQQTEVSKARVEEVMKTQTLAEVEKRIARGQCQRKVKRRRKRSRAPE